MKQTRKTRQKELIRSEITSFSSFFTADELFDKIKIKDPNVGMATVYRLLKDLRKRKELHSFLCERRMVYSQDTNNHCHFICQKCDRIEHFSVDKIDFLRTKIKGDICHFQIDVHGICDECLRLKKN